MPRPRYRGASQTLESGWGSAYATATPTLAVDLVEHDTLGAGVVTNVESNGVVSMRFSDGSTRGLKVSYAPLRRIDVFAEADDISF